MDEDKVKAMILVSTIASILWIAAFMALEKRLHSDAIEAGVARYNAVSGGFEYIRKETK